MTYTAMRLGVLFLCVAAFPLTGASRPQGRLISCRRCSAGACWTYAIVAIDQAEPIPSERNRAFFERILKSGQTITVAENERRALDLRVSNLVDDR